MRQSYPDLNDILPPVTFYRLEGQACTPESQSKIGDPEMTDGFTYLIERAQIVSLSYIAATSKPDSLISAIKANLGAKHNLLFVPAGNPPSTNLDDADATCPPCLANPDGDWPLKKLLVVVGAATRDLRRASYSGYGAWSVRLYAPGEPQGAVDLQGRPADPTDAATSYATPYAAFAAALLTSIGAEINWATPAAPGSIRARLMLSTWPLANETDFPQARVVDLMKVAAARFQYRRGDGDRRGRCASVAQLCRLGAGRD